MASSLPAIILYAGSAATYVCESGDVQPTYPLLPPISTDLLRLLQSAQPVARLADHHLASLGHGVDAIREHLFPLLRHRTVFLVLPLSGASSYAEEWVRFCFHSAVGVKRLVVLSDAVADSFACGRDSCAVLHVSLNTLSVSRVEAGCSTRYSSSHAGSIHALCGEAVTLKLIGELPRAAAAAAASNAAQDNDDSDSDDALAAADISVRRTDTEIDLSDVKYRDGLVRAFGYKAYRAVIAVPLQRRLEAETKGSSKGKGKGKGRVTSSLLTALKSAYTRTEREAPGQLEKLVARVLQRGSPSGDTEPCVLAGEALALPYVLQLYTYVICHCGNAVWAAVEREREAKQRRVRSMPNETDSGAHHTPHEKEGRPAHAQESLSSTSAPKRRRTETSSSSSGSETESDDESSSDEDDAWLHLQPTPLPTAPWWLPLLGASVVSRLPDQDLQRAIISEGEARESNGTIVHWKTLQ